MLFRELLEMNAPHVFVPSSRPDEPKQLCDVCGRKQGAPPHNP